ncbi:disintegrin and metalloproteinase domain-containing protein 5-like, partial [Carlito syrichta]|uniref:Disintegrin and metalloproteinase domain-containing protein 5-like n=1 Tax=Carlito syrichta TaxID=1868482 RepID=A0A3Q0DH56_CARSF
MALVVLLEVAYALTIEGKPYLVDLKKQSFFSPTAAVYSYNKYDIKISEPLLHQMDCNYKGYVVGILNSLVTLSTCSGLRGTVQLENISYGIEPLEAVSGFVHMIYEEKNDNTNIPLLGENDTYAWLSSQYQVRKRSGRTEFTKLVPRYLKMHIVVDKDLFDYMGSDTKTVTQKIIQLIGLVNAMLTQLKLTIVISSIEIWSNENKISTTGHPDGILNQFSKWKQNSDFKIHDFAYLLAFRKHPTFIGATFPGQACDENYVAGVALYTEGLSLESYSVIIVQLLGLNLGLIYDNTDICHCSGDVCIMTPKAVYSGGVKDFSICSLDDFKYLASNGGLKCLQSNIVNTPVYKQLRRICGNGVLESPEECDCGTKKNCTHVKCCDPSKCKLKGGFACGSGECCTQDCKLKAVNTLCRAKADEQCDFVEYCNGRDSYCKEDTYAHDGEYCDSGGAFCYLGKCITVDKQCSFLVKKESRGGSFSCFDEVNTRGDNFGNCVTGHCDFGNALCGKLVCVWDHKELIEIANLSVIYTHIRGDICVSGVLPRRMPVPENPPRSSTQYYVMGDRDETFVADGTMCGPEMYCDKTQCKHVRFLRKAHICDNHKHCENHGICNNFFHCHCEKGFAPPNCTARKGDFGSPDDGHLVPWKKSYLERRFSIPQKHQFQLTFYISVPVLIITIAVLMTQKKIREICYRNKTESESFYAFQELVGKTRDSRQDGDGATWSVKPAAKENCSGSLVLAPGAADPKIAACSSYGAQPLPLLGHRSGLDSHCSTDAAAAAAAATTGSTLHHLGQRRSTTSVLEAPSGKICWDCCHLSCKRDVLLT